MADRRVKVNLELDAKGYADGARQASKSTQELQKQVLDTGKAAQKAADDYNAATRKQQDAAGKLRVAQEQLNKARATGDSAKIAAAEERVATATRNSEEATRRAAGAQEGYQSALRASSGAQEAYAAQTDKAAKATERLGKFIDDNRQDMQTAGAALAGVGAAVGVLGAAVAKTGIEYNTLQQTSGAALETIMGSGSAAADQMDRLNEFASSSPFSKAMFIEAQQQLLAFGVEAERVVPILESVQDAVAATGGSNQDISELVSIIAKMSSTAKITAEDLNQLGERGIDAATIIGEQMGMTGAQIRESITDGTLDAGAAIEALTEGMSEQFGGAAAGVKDTFEGAMDRVKAAWRDVSAELMTGLVDPDGGGMLIGLANNVADVMRAFQGLPDPVKNGVAAMTGIAGVAAAGTGGLLLLAPAAHDTVKAFQALNKNVPGAVSALKGLGRLGVYAAGIAAVGTAVTMLNDAMNNTVQTTDQLELSLRRASRAGDGVAPALNELFDISHDYFPTYGAINNLGDALRQINPQSAVEHMKNFETTVLGLPGVTKDAYEAFGVLDETLSTLDTSEAGDYMNQLRVEAEALGFTDFSNWESLQERMPEYTQRILELADATGKNVSEQDLFQAAMGNLPPAMREAADGSDELGGAMQEAAGDAENLVAELEDMIDALFELGRQNRSEAEAQGAFSEAIRTANEELGKNTRNFDVNTEKGMANRQMLHDIATEMETVVEAQARGGASSEDLAGSMQTAYDEVLKLTGGNEELARSIMGIPPGVDIETWMDDTAYQMAISTASEIEALPGHVPIEVAISENGTAGQVQERINSVTGKTEYVFVTEDGTTVSVQKKIVEINGVSRTVWVDDNGTVYDTQGKINQVDDGNATVWVDANTSAAEAQISRLLIPRTLSISTSVQGGLGAIGRAMRLRAGGGVAGGPEFPKYETGRLPQYAMGRLPYTGLGTDRILGVNAQGTPVAMVDDGEGVIRESSTRKHPHLLSMVNDDDPRVSAMGRMLGLPGYAAGRPTGREWSASSVSVGMDYDRLARAMQDGRAMFRNEQYITATDPMEAAHMSKTLLEHGLRSGVAV